MISISLSLLFIGTVSFSFYKNAIFNINVKNKYNKKSWHEKSTHEERCLSQVNARNHDESFSSFEINAHMAYVIYYEHDK